MKNNGLCPALLTLCLIAPGLYAETPKVDRSPLGIPEGLSPIEAGDYIVQEGEKRAEGFKDMTASAQMILRNARGGEAIREMDIKIMEVEDGGKGLTVVQAPKDVKGTSLLTWSWDDKDDEQWLYLPALKRVKRIASGNKNGPFMGSEFTYEDFSGQPPEKYITELLRTEKLHDIDMFVMQRTPKPELKSGYSKTIAWIDQIHLRMYQVHYFDKNDKHVKTLTASGYQHYEDEWWRADELLMTNLFTGSSTQLVWRDVQFDQQLTERDFDVNALKGAR